MEIYIDNTRYEILEKNFNFSRAMNEINKILKKQDKVLLTLHVNGSNIEENSVVSSENVKLIEVSTRSHREIILESFGFFSDYLDYYFDLTDDIISGESAFIDAQKLYDVMQFIAWTYSLLLAIKDSTAIDLNYYDYDEFVQSFKMSFEAAQKAYENQDIEVLFDILEIELGEFLIDIENNLEGYEEQITKEEVMKNLLN